METTLAHPAVPPKGAVSACQGAFVLTLAAQDWAADVDLVYLSTRYYLDPDVASLPDADTELLFVRGIAYAGAEDTGGFIPEAIVPSLIRRRRHAAAVEALVARSLWLPASGDRGQPGYRIARWQEWQEELEALERRRAADRERKRRERARQAAETAEPPRKRGRPRKKPQVKNTSRDVSAFSSADSPNNASSESRSKDLDSDFDLDSSLINPSSAVDARARGASDDDLADAVIAAVLKREELDLDRASALKVGVMAVSRRKKGPPTDRAAYAAAVIANEKDLYAELLRDIAPPLDEILAERDRAPDAHPFRSDGAPTPTCLTCSTPETNYRHTDFRQEAAAS